MQERAEIVSKELPGYQVWGIQSANEQVRTSYVKAPFNFDSLYFDLEVFRSLQLLCPPP